MKQKVDKRKPGLIDGLYVITLVYFGLGFVSIYTALSALVCMSLPFLLIWRHQEKRWCHHYCPRASLTSLTGRSKATWKHAPKSWRDGSAKRFMLWYFSLNLLFIAGSTIQVGLGALAPMPYIRLFIAIPLWPIWQLFEPVGPQWLVHLSYRFYSMMLSSTLLGIIFSRLWRPRSWCAVCPVGTISNKMTPPPKEMKTRGPT